MFTSIAGDAPADQQGFLGPVAAQRLKDGVDKEVLHTDLRKVPADEGLVVLPQPVGDLRHGRLGDEHVPRRIAEGILHIAGGQPARVHLGDQPLKHFAVAVQKAHQRRPERLTYTTHLWQGHLDRALGGAHPTGLIAIA
jgi:hypothetical protein